jgi:two-component system nitrate/nitrite response regulator NarL
MIPEVLIVDDSAAFLEAARKLLERDGVRVVGVASTSAMAISEAVRLRPHVVLVDIMLGGESGFALARSLVDELPGAAPVVVILTSTHTEADFEDLIADSPAAGFVPKSELSAQAIRLLLSKIAE